MTMKKGPLGSLRAAAEDDAFDRFGSSDHVDTNRAIHILAFERGFRFARELLSSKDAEKKCIEGTKGVGSFVSHTEWADWLDKTAHDLKDN